MMPDEEQAKAQKIFTPSEANALLPQVKVLLEQLQQLHRSILKTNQQLDERVSQLAQGNGYPHLSIKEQVKTLTTHQMQLIEAFESALKQLECLGCVLKDLSVGLVDFYTLRDGQQMCLCWRSGEEQIRYWHSLEEGYAGRQPID